MSCVMAMDCATQSPVPHHYWQPRLHLHSRLYADPACHLNTRTNPNGTPHGDADEVTEGNCRSWSTPFSSLDYWQSKRTPQDDLCVYGNCKLHVYREAKCKGEAMTLEHANNYKNFIRAFKGLRAVKTLISSAKRNPAGYGDRIELSRRIGEDWVRLAAVARTSSSQARRAELTVLPSSVYAPETKTERRMLPLAVNGVDIAKLDDVTFGTAASSARRTVSSS